MRVELREVEDVADEPLEPLRLGLDDLERGARELGSSTSPSARAETCPRIAVSGVRSSCETDIRKLRSRASASASRSRHLAEALGEVPDLSGRRSGTSTS